MALQLLANVSQELYVIELVYTCGVRLLLQIALYISGSGVDPLGLFIPDVEC